MTFSTAAHPPFLLYRRSTGEVTQEEIPGHLLGITPGAEFEEHEIALEEGDLLFCYTDGLTDRRTEAGEFYPIERIAEIITSNGERSCQDIYQAIIDDVTDFSPVEDFRDDVAFTVARIS